MATQVSVLSHTRLCWHNFNLPLTISSITIAESLRYPQSDPLRDCSLDDALNAALVQAMGTLSLAPSPIHADPKTVALLLQAGANPNAIAVMGGLSTWARFLRQIGRDQPPISDQVKLRLFDVFSELLSHGVDTQVEAANE